MTDKDTFLCETCELATRGLPLGKIMGCVAQATEWEIRNGHLVHGEFQRKFTFEGCKNYNPLLIKNRTIPQAHGDPIGNGECAR